MTETRTFDLLKRWHAGDRAALGDLIARDLPFIRAQVLRRLGNVVRSKDDTDDIVQEALVEVLEYGPKFVVADSDRFRALLCRIVENVVRMKHRALHRERRDVRRERRLPTVIDLDSPITSPTQAAARSDENAWLELAVELLEPADREVLDLRQWQGLEFPDIGERLGIDKDAARMRFRRAMTRLGRVLRRLRAGELSQLLAENEDQRPA